MVLFAKKHMGNTASYELGKSESLGSPIFGKGLNFQEKLRNLWYSEMLDYTIKLPGSPDFERFLNLY